MRSLKQMPLVMRLTRSSLSVSLIIALGSCLGACITDQTGSPEISVACSAFNPVRWSHSDTPDTVRQVVGNNAVGVKLCPDVPKWKPKRH